MEDRDVITEGKVRILKEGVVGQLSPASSRKRPAHTNLNEAVPGVASLSNSTLFYNPAQVFNRDLSLVVIKVFGQRRIEAVLKRFENATHKVRVGEEVKGLRICEPLAATGLRSLRYAAELPRSVFRHVCASDIDPSAVAGAKINQKLNQIPESEMSVICADASEMLHSGKYICNTSQWDVVDIDPYGTAAPFLDGAIRATRDGGLLCVTSTDMPVLGGNAPDVAFCKYGGTTVKARYLHEMALRLVIHQMQLTASKYRRLVVPLLSLSVDFYVRIFVQILDKPVRCAETASLTAVVFQCSNCDFFVTQPFGHYVERTRDRSHKRRRRDAKEEPEDASENVECGSDTEAACPKPVESPRSLHTVNAYGIPETEGKHFQLPRVSADMPGQRCPQCESKLSMAGPFYAGPLHDFEFVGACLAELDKIGRSAVADDVELGNLVNDSALRGEILDGATELSDGPGNWEWVHKAKARFEYEMTSFQFTSLSPSVLGKVKGVLLATQEELPDIPLFYKLPSICNCLHISMIKLDRFRSALMHMGYRVGLFHREPLSVKTDAPAHIIFDLVRAWVVKEMADKSTTSAQPNKFGRIPQWFHLNLPEKMEANFSYHPQITEKRNQGSARWVPNPTSHWGPGRRAGKPQDRV